MASSSRSTVDPAAGRDKCRRAQVQANPAEPAVQRREIHAGRRHVSTVEAARASAAWSKSASADTGIGIAPEDCDAVFEEFRQVGSDYTQESGRHGARAWRSRASFVELHGGKIRVDERGRQRLDIHFQLCRLPRCRQCRGRALIDQGSKMANELILIVEDNEKNRKLVRDILQFKGIPDCWNRKPPRKASGSAQEKKPALILMDFHLPGIERHRGASRCCAPIRRRARFRSSRSPPRR